MHFRLTNPTPDLRVDPLAGHLKGRTERDVDRAIAAHVEAERSRPKREAEPETAEQTARRMGEALAGIYVQRGIDVQIVDKDLIREGFTQEDIFRFGDEAIAEAHRIIAEAANGRAA